MQRFRDVSSSYLINNQQISPRHGDRDGDRSDATLVQQAVNNSKGQFAN
jgi:hypothetical protein